MKLISQEDCDRSLPTPYPSNLVPAVPVLHWFSNTFLISLNCFSILSKNYMWSISLLSPVLFISLPRKSWKSDSICPLTLFFEKTIWAILGPLKFCINFK